MNMRVCLSALFVSFISIVYADIDIKLLRNLLNESTKSEKAATQLFEQTKNFDTENRPLLIGFKAMSEFMLCNHVSNVFSKLNHFNTGKKLLEDAIKKEQKNPELIYFRFITQTNVPSLLGYSNNIKDDKEFLIKYVKDNFSNANKDVDLYNRIKKYLLQCKVCGEMEKESIKKL